MNKTATQSAVFGYGEAWKAVDGFYGESYDNGQCTHTNEGLSWWKVDLAKQHIVAAVRITNRNALSERLSKFIVMVDTQMLVLFKNTSTYTHIHTRTRTRKRTRIRINTHAHKNLLKRAKSSQLLKNVKVE